MVSTQRRRTVASCIAAVTVLVAATACGGSDTRSPAAGSAAGPATLLAAWAARSLPDGTPLAVDDARTRELVTAAGLGVTVQAPSAAAPGAPDRYRVAADTTPGVAVRTLASGVTAVPVARFGTGAGGLVVDRLVATAAPEVARAQADDLARRIAAGTALLTNPTVVTDAGARGALAAGSLDLRAAAVVAVLATSTRVEIVEVVADPAETAAGRPARSLVVGGVSPGAVRAVAAATVGDYRPTITGVTTDTATLLWNLTATSTLTGVQS